MNVHWIYRCLLVRAAGGTDAIWAARCSPSTACPASRASDGGYDNARPAGLAGAPDGLARPRQRGPGQQLRGAALFHWCGVIAHQLGAPQARLDILAFVYIVLRFIYITMYVAGLPMVRSGVWTLALLVNIGILFVGYR
jgi:uncharacterized MAPEG superfamily protein